MSVVRKAHHNTHTGMTKGTVVIHLSPFSKPLRRAHQGFEEDAKTITRLKGYDFAGYYAPDTAPSGCLLFVSDQTLLLEEAQTRHLVPRMISSEHSSASIRKDEIHNSPACQTQAGGLVGIILAGH
jgi:hypothetical protein